MRETSTGSDNAIIGTVNQRIRAELDDVTVINNLRLIPISLTVAKTLLVPNHYSHSLPGGTKLIFGVMLNTRLFGAMTFGVGPYLGYKLVNESTPDDCVTLTRLWLSSVLKCPRIQGNNPFSHLKYMGIDTIHEVVRLMPRMFLLSTK